MEDSAPGGGCSKSLVGCGAILLVALLVLVIGGYVAMYHTSWPAQAIVALLNASPDVQIEGVSGSFSSGFAVESMRFTDDNGNVNELKDARLRYQQEDDTFTITEIHLGSAHLFVDFNDGQGKLAVESESSDSHADHGTTSAGDGGDMTLVIRKGSINDVKLEDIKTGEVFHLKSVELDDLVIGRGVVKLGRFVVDSSTCKLQVLPEAGKDHAYTVEGRFEKDFHRRILEPITVSGGIHVKGATEFDLNLNMLGGSIAINKQGPHVDICRIRNLNPAKFIGNLPPIGKLDIDYATTEKDVSINGSFLFGDKPFTIDQKIIKAQATPDTPLVARHASGGVKYELKMSEPRRGDTRFKMALVTEPNMPLKKALAQLLFNQSPEGLPAEKRKELEAVVKHFEK